MATRRNLSESHENNFEPREQIAPTTPGGGHSLPPITKDRYTVACISKSHLEWEAACQMLDSTYVSDPNDCPHSKRCVCGSIAGQNVVLSQTDGQGEATVIGRGANPGGLVNAIPAFLQALRLHKDPEAASQGLKKVEMLPAGNKEVQNLKRITISLRSTAEKKEPAPKPLQRLDLRRAPVVTAAREKPPSSTRQGCQNCRLGRVG